MTLIGATRVAQITVGPDQVHLRLLATSDLHAHLLPYDYFTASRASGVGLARLVDVIDAARGSAPNALLFDNGDTLQGTPLADIIHSEILPKGGRNPMIVAMNALEFDAGTLGNHDFDFGLEYLERSLARADFPITLANAHRADGTQFLPPNTMLKRQVQDGSGKTHDLKIGVVGVVPPQVSAWSRLHVEGILTFSDIIASTADQVTTLRAQGADLIVVLAHSGLGDASAPAGAENVARQIAALNGVDAVVAGHTHNLATCDGTDLSAPIVQPAAFGTHLGMIDLLLSESENDTGWHAAPVQVVNLATPVTQRRSGMPRPRLLNGYAQLRREIASAHRTTRTCVERPLGHSTIPLQTLFSTLAPCAATQLVADAQRAAAAPLLAARPDLAGLPILSAAAPFRAGGRSGPENYTDIPAGALKLRHAADLYIYPNAMCALRIDGAGLLQWLERCASMYRQIDRGAQTPQKLIDHSFAPYNFDRITGLSYRIDVSQPPRTDVEGGRIDPTASRIRDLRFADGRPVWPDDQALVITNSYRAAGGGHFASAAAAETVLAGNGSVRDAVAHFMAEAEGPLDPVIEPTFAFEPLGGTQVIFETGPGALAHPCRMAKLNLRPADPDAPNGGFVPFFFEI